MKEITDDKFLQVYQDLHEHLSNRGLKLSHMGLDDEESPSFQHALQ